MSGRAKRILCVSAVVIVLSTVAVVGLVLWANVAICSATKRAIYDRADQTPARPVAIVFGARVWGQKPSRILRDRLDAGIRLYHLRKVEKLLLSGDHGRHSYDEVNAMGNYAVAKGVRPEDVFLDHAGFRTYDTLYRARQVFGIRRVVLVTNRFHLPRAVYTARRFGLDAVGLESDTITYRSWFRNECRECLARTLAWMQVNVTRPRPKYLGKTIDIQGDGRVTHDRPVDSHRMETGTTEQGQ